LTPRDFEHATGWDFDTQEEFIDHLKPHWMVFYPDTQPAAYVGGAPGMSLPLVAL
jgi:hypothetical protein